MAVVLEGLVEVVGLRAEGDRQRGDGSNGDLDALADLRCEVSEVSNMGGKEVTF